MQQDAQAADAQIEGVEPAGLSTLLLKKRDGREVVFDASRIYRAIEKAFKAEAGFALEHQLSEQLEAVVLALT
ncbi:MAG TPA: ATP cone domain-containing protein, partial [Kiritimatiellia bacterium]